MSISLVNINMDKILVDYVFSVSWLRSMNEVLGHGKATEMDMKALGFFQIHYLEKFLKMPIMSFEHLQIMHNFAKLQLCGSKNEPVVPILNLKLNYSYIC